MYKKNEMTKNNKFVRQYNYSMIKFQKKVGRNNDYARATYNINIKITFKFTVLKSSLCDYSEESILYYNNYNNYWSSHRYNSKARRQKE